MNVDDARVSTEAEELDLVHHRLHVCVLRTEDRLDRESVQRIVRKRTD